MQAAAILLIVAVHDALLVVVGCVLANKFYGLSPDASHVALNQALRVYGNPSRGNPIHSSQRYCLYQSVPVPEQSAIITVNRSSVV